MANLAVNYKYCIVPQCKSTTIATPGKEFLAMPKDREIRRKWCLAMKRDDKKNPPFSTATTRFVCEDHFDLKTDLENYVRYSLQGGSKYLKKGVVPHIFDCQKSPLKVKQKGKRIKKENFNDFWSDQPASSKKPDVSTSKAAVPAAATSSSDPAETAFEPEVIIKEEPIDIVDETDAPSKSKEEFILGGLPSTIPSTTSGHTPTLGLAYSVADIKAEPTSPTVNGGRRTSKRTGGVLASEEKRQRDCDVVGETVSEPSPAKKDQFDAYGEYIAAKLRKLDWKSCAYVQKAIGDIMFEAEMGKFRNSVV